MVTVIAPAKLTVSLRMTGLRDDGYHLIDAEMVTLDFGDDSIDVVLTYDAVASAAAPASDSMPSMDHSGDDAMNDMDDSDS